MVRTLILLVLVLSSANAAMACGGHGKSRKRANLRACFANQKTLVGAIEMWNLDKNCKMEHHLARGENVKAYMRPDSAGGGCTFEHAAFTGGPGVSVITPSAFAALKEGGYLQSVPKDPGQGPDTETHYAVTYLGNGIVCLHHGLIDAPGRHSAFDTAREQLFKAGVTDPAVLALASDEDPFKPDWRDEPELVVMWIAAILSCLVSCWRARRNADVTGTSLLFGAIKWGAVWVLLAIPMAIVGLEYVTYAGVAAQFGAGVAGLLVGIVGVLSHEASPQTRYEAPSRWKLAEPLPLAHPAGLKCAVCATDGGPAGWVACPSCDAAHHGECWTFQDGCAAFGCAMAHGRWRSGAKARPTVAAGEPEKPGAAVIWIS